MLWVIMFQVSHSNVDIPICHYQKDDIIVIIDRRAVVGLKLRTDTVSFPEGSVPFDKPFP